MKIETTSYEDEFFTGYHAQAFIRLSTGTIAADAWAETKNEAENLAKTRLNQAIAEAVDLYQTWK